MSADAAGAAPLGVAVVGAGVIGRLHAQVLADVTGAELRAVVDVDLDRARELAAEFGVPAVGSLAEALAPAAGVDVVAICTPSGLHAAAAIEAMQAGRHVLIEKPIDVDDARAAAIDQARRRNGVHAAVISQHRFDPASEAVAAAIADGELGRVTSAVASIPWWRGDAYYASGAWRGTRALDGGGALMNQGIHTIDLLVAFLGRPAEVVGFTARLAHEGIEVEDTAAGAVRFASGALATIHATTAAYPGLPTRLQIHGDAGSAILEGDSLVLLHHDALGREEFPMGNPQAAAEARTGHGATGSADDGAVGMPGQAHRRQYEDLVHAIRTGEPVRVGTGEARRALAVINALYASSDSGRAVTITDLGD